MSTKPKRWLATHQSGTYLGELFKQKKVDWDDGDTGVARSEENFNPPDICANRHRGNAESESAFRSIKDRLTKAQERVLKCIRESDGLTCNEIAEKLGATPNEISGRCSELKRDSKIYKSGTRLTRSGCPAAILRAL